MLNCEAFFTRYLVWWIHMPIIFLMIKVLFSLSCRYKKIERINQFWWNVWSCSTNHNAIAHNWLGNNRFLSLFSRTECSDQFVPKKTISLTSETKIGFHDDDVTYVPVFVLFDEKWRKIKRIISKGKECEKWFFKNLKIKMFLLLQIKKLRW